MSKNSVKQEIKNENSTKRKQLFTGDYKKDIPYFLNISDELNKQNLISMRDYLKYNMPEIYEEINNDILYKPWFMFDNKILGLCKIKYNNKIVGFASYTIGNLSEDIKFAKIIILNFIYILKEFRGKNIGGKLITNLLNTTLDNGAFLVISKPNYYLMKSLEKNNLCFNVSDDFNLSMVPFGLFLIDKDTEVMTSFYDFESKYIMTKIDNKLVKGQRNLVDTAISGFDFLKYDCDNDFARQYYSNISKEMDILLNATELAIQNIIS